MVSSLPIPFSRIRSLMAVVLIFCSLGVSPELFGRLDSIFPAVAKAVSHRGQILASLVLSDSFLLSKLAQVDDAFGTESCSDFSTVTLLQTEARRVRAIHDLNKEH